MGLTKIMNTQFQLGLPQLGWRPIFQSQLSLQDLESYHPARVIAQHKSLLQVLTAEQTVAIEVRPDMPPITVGDWLLVDEKGQFGRLLERCTELFRKAPGSNVAKQLIAANVDTLFIVSSMNQDFSLNRIERYLAIANESGCEPVVVLTKSDCCESPEDYLSQVRQLDPFLAVEGVNALDESALSQLLPWCKGGNTVVVLGSSGVGKSTLINQLTREDTQLTAGIREDDSKGRHTTTGRSMHFMPQGGIIIDTPGVRELQIADCESGIESTFADISELSRQCRFSDCLHDSEPGCAVRQALEEGAIDLRRLNNYRKLLREQARNARTLAESRQNGKQFARLVRATMKDKHSR